MCTRNTCDVRGHHIKILDNFVVNLHWEPARLWYTFSAIRTAHVCIQKYCVHIGMQDLSLGLLLLYLGLLLLWALDLRASGLLGFRALGLYGFGALGLWGFGALGL